MCLNQQVKGALQTDPFTLKITTLSMTSTQQSRFLKVANLQRAPYVFHGDMFENHKRKECSKSAIMSLGLAKKGASLF